MRYLQRDKEGKMIGHYANVQAFVTEEVEDDHSEIVAFNKKKERDRFEIAERNLSLISRIEALEKRIVVLERKT